MNVGKGELQETILAASKYKLEAGYGGSSL
jgi:hypothetical protein